jgi:hypothetical protein
LGSEASQGVGVIIQVKSREQAAQNHEKPQDGTVYGLRRGAIRKHIVRSGMRAIVPGFGVGKHIGHLAGAISLLQKEARQFKTLQRVPKPRGGWVERVVIGLR